MNESYPAGFGYFKKVAIDPLEKKIIKYSGCEQITDFTTGKGYDTTGTTVDINSPSTSSSLDCKYVSCVEGDIFSYHGKGTSSYRPYAFLTSDGTIIAKGDNHATGDYVITAPTNTAYVVFNMVRSNGYEVYKGYLPTIHFSNIEDELDKTMMLKSTSALTDINDVDTYKTGYYNWTANGTHPANEPTFTVGKGFQLINLIRGETNSNDRSVQIIIVMPTDVSTSSMYYRYKVSGAWTEWVELVTMESRWCNGKTINWIGDSIVSGGDFDELVCNALGMEENDYGISGSTIALKGDGTDGRDAVVARYSNMSNDADIIAVSAGTNDWMYAWSPIGDIDSIANTTFYGALKNLCAGLIDKYPDKVIFFTTPIKRAQAFANGDGGEYSANGVDTTPFSKNKYGLTLMDYCDIIKEVCGYYSIPVLDMNRESGLNPHLTSQAIYFSDKTHPNSDGRRLMARRVAGWLTQLAYSINT